MLLVLQRAINEARAGRYRDVACPGEAEHCPDPVALLGGLDYVRAVATGGGGDGNQYRIEASFLIEADATYEAYWHHSIEAGISDFPVRGDPIRRLGQSRLGRSEMISN